MSVSPRTTFIFENNNVDQSTPTLGISFLFARTTKGPKLDPSTVISNVTKFKEKYGEEITPGSTISQIEEALKGGSKLRICRVMGAGATKGSVNGSFTFTADGKSVSLGLKTQGYGDPVNGRNTFKVKAVTRNYAT